MVKEQLKALINDQRGNIIILLGILVFMLIVGASLSVDIARAQVLRARMQAQVDSAALAVGLAYNKTPNMTQAEMQSVALKYFTGGFPSGYLGAFGTSTNVAGKNGVPDLVVTNDNSGHITLTATAYIPTYFTELFHVNKILLSSHSTVLHDTLTPTEIVLALDITGSMAISLTPGGASKYTGLYNAANHILSIFSTANTNNNIYVGIVPYTQTVNIGVPGVASVPLNSNPASSPLVPYWNLSNSWMDASDPSLNSVNYDWGDAPGTPGYAFPTHFPVTSAEYYTNATPGWNVIGQNKPYGWGGCVMARNPAVQGSQSGLPLDISDDSPSVAPFQRFYYPNDNSSSLLNDEYSNPSQGKYVGQQPCKFCGDPYIHLGNGTSTLACTSGDASICTVAESKDDVYCGYIGLWGYNAWMCNSPADTLTPTYLIRRVTNNSNMFDAYTYSGSWVGPATGGPNYSCPLTTTRTPISILPLQPAQSSALVGEINYINQIGTADTSFSNATTIDIGLAWAWRLLSPRWAGFWNDVIDTTPALNYRVNPPANLARFVILMTDGTNNTVNANTTYNWGKFLRNSYTAYGFGLPSALGVNPVIPPTLLPLSPPDENYLDQKTLALCQAMRNSGITLYAVGFGTVGTGTGTDVNASLLTSCVGDPAKFFLASDNAALDTAFQNIAQSILNTLRLTQ